LPDLRSKPKTGAELLRAVESANINDRLSLSRLVDAVEDLEDEKECSRIARVFSDKLKAAGVWHKHPFRKRLELLIR
jgi:hypothetical protein